MNDITVVFIIFITGVAVTIAICCCECCCECCSVIELNSEITENDTNNSSPLHIEI